MPSAKKLGDRPRSLTGASACASRRSLRIREINRLSIQEAPVIHMTPRMTAVGPHVMSHMGSPIPPSGLAHVKWGAQSLSMSAPEGRTKLNPVATQIQYFVVALARGID